MWESFLDLARSLRDQAAAPGVDPKLASAMRRSAVSRAYYAAYNVTKDALHAAGIPMPAVQGGGDHARVIEAARRAGHRPLANLLTQLKEMRQQADYEAGPRCGPAVVEAALESAAAALALAKAI